MSDIYLSITETPAVVTLSQPVISGALSSTVTVANTVTVALDANSLSALEQVTVTVGAAVSVSNFPASQVVSVSNLPAATTVTGTVALDSASLAALENVTVAVGGAVSVSNFPSTQTVAGTVTANINGTVPVSGTFWQNTQPVSLASLPTSTVTVSNLPSTQTIAGTVTANVESGTILYVEQVRDGDGNTFGIDRDFPISGTVTANVPALMSSAVIGASSIAVVGQNQTSPNPTHGIQIGYISDISGTFVNVMDDGYQQLPVKGTVTIGSCVTHGVTVANSVTIGAVPNGVLTTRFGTPTTANTAFATSAVTNTSRKYLLIQNVTTGSNVITVGIGFTPTTTQGIQLTAGAGITFESSYIPTGAVQILSSVTASNFTILEA